MKANIEARKHFGILGNYDLVLHHKDITLRQNDPERYAEWRPEDLVVMTRSEHTKLHISLGDALVKRGCGWNKGKKMSEELCCKMKEAARIRDSEKGNPATWDDTKRKMSEAAKNRVGTHYWTNGEKVIRAVECPEGFWKYTYKR